MTYVVIVTYGNRKTYLLKVIQFFSYHTSLHIVIVDNNSDISLEKISELYENPIVNIIHSSTNRGSAWGFKTGIQYAYRQQNCEMIWLLDDDNLPEPYTLEKLQIQFDQLQIKNKNNNLALMSFRTDRKYLSNLLLGESIKWNFPQENAFLGFHFFKLHYKILKKINLFRIKKMSNNIVIPCAPYGGLFFHKDLITRIGFPDERFFVYADDFEFTYRITKLGGVIILITDAKINDLEQTWQIKKSGSIFSTNILDVDNNKVYFSTRNFIVFQKLHLVSNNFIFNFNKIIYSNYLSLLAFIKGKQTNYLRFKEATSDGLRDNFNNKKYPI